MLAILVVLLAIEFVADKIPLVDHVNDVVQTFVRPTAGGLAFGAASSSQTVTVSEPGRVLHHPSMGADRRRRRHLVPDAHSLKATARPVINATTAGFGAPVASTAEDVFSVVMSFVAIVFPVLIIVFLILLVWLFVVLRRRRRRRKEAKRARREAELMAQQANPGTARRPHPHHQPLAIARAAAGRRQLGRPGRRSRHGRGQAGRWFAERTTLTRPSMMPVISKSFGVNTRATPGGEQRPRVLGRDDAADHDRDRPRRPPAVRRRTSGTARRCEPDSTDRPTRSHALLHRGRDDLRRGEPDPLVDHLEAGVARPHRDLLRPVRVAVQPGLPTSNRNRAAQLRGGRPDPFPHRGQRLSRSVDDDGRPDDARSAPGTPRRPRAAHRPTRRW